VRLENGKKTKKSKKQELTNQNGSARTKF